MPLTLTITEGVLPKGAEKSVFKQLCEVMLQVHGLSGNKVLTPNVLGSIVILPREHIYAGLEEGDVVFIEWKVPAFAFAEREVQQAYVKEATQIIHDASGGKLLKEKIWVNVVHAVDGAWGIAGNAFTNAELAAAVAKG